MGLSSVDRHLTTDLALGPRTKSGERNVTGVAAIATGCAGALPTVQTPGRGRGRAKTPTDSTALLRHLSTRLRTSAL
eukprot:scaffold1535_cov382-Prasinococcus_capsulatus_cf.AAC.55